MADPAWGMGASSLTRTRHAHCPTFATHQSHSPCSVIAFFGPSSNSSSNKSSHPMLAQCDEAVDMNAPSTSSDDWQRRHQFAILEQLEQQRDLRIQMNQHQQQQQEKQMQQQHMEVQKWQQEQVQRQQVQAQRHVERILQPRYSTSVGGLHQTGRTNELCTLRAPTPSFGSGGGLKL
ncbi:unnamed protein product [Peronospora destructor]|uniref:Uncharacterized protein n=1 Tax=Peronospora destructor TaxID=86335 RepID=A0AAV0VEF5_9STRA|nr:unnamed protein product [Peronospora destructor]